MNTSFGQTLRQAREAKGLSTSQVAQRTRILVQIIEEMEHEDFHRIAAPIYGRGFVRLFAECVDLDPQPLIREFMDIYEGRRAPTVLVRDVPAAPAPEPPPPEPEPSAPPVPEPPPAEPEPFEPPAPETPAPEPQAVPEPPSAPEPPPAAVRGLDLFDRPAVQTPFAAPTSDLDLFPPRQPLPPAPDRPAQEPAAPQAADLLRAGYAESAGPSASERFRKGLSSVSHGVVQSVRGIPRSAWRIALLVLVACAVVGLVVFACAKLYQATAALPAAPAAPRPPAQETKGGLEILPTDPPQSRRPAPAARKPAAAPKRPAGALRSTGPRVPPLYAD